MTRYLKILFEINLFNASVTLVSLFYQDRKHFDVIITLFVVIPHRHDR